MPEVRVGKIWVLSEPQCKLLGIALGGVPITLYQSVCEKYWWGHKNPHDYTYKVGQVIHDARWISLDGTIIQVEPGWYSCAQHVSNKTLGIPTEQAGRYVTSLHSKAEISIKAWSYGTSIQNK